MQSIRTEHKTANCRLMWRIDTRVEYEATQNSRNHNKLRDKT